jgi:hypothetical protein
MLAKTIHAKMEALVFLLVQTPTIAIVRQISQERIVQMLHLA